jgi:hypothetical protein
MIKGTLFGFSMLLMSFSLAQDISFQDSLLWSSPISAHAVRTNRIKKIIVSEKGWKHECKRCPDHPSPKMFKDVYAESATTFEYDTLGFTVAITREGHTQKNKNIYNFIGQLVESEFFYKNDEGKLLPAFRNLREYNSQGLLSKSTMYYRNELFRINEYTYDSSGRIIELNDKRTHFSSGAFVFETYMIIKYEYDQNNRLYRQSELIPSTDPKAKWHDRSFYFYFDLRNKDSLSVQLFDGDTLSTLITTIFSPTIKTRVVKDFKHNKVSELRSCDVITNELRYLWDFNYGDRVVWPRCRIYELKTGLILNEKKEVLWQQLQKLVVKNGVVAPKHPFDNEFSDKSTSVSYKYFFRD